MPLPPAADSLYERLGGHRALGILVRNFYLSLQAHPVLGFAEPEAAETIALAERLAARMQLASREDQPLA